MDQTAKYELVRRLEAIVLERMAEEPVLLIQGPRSVGKSVLLRRLAREVGVAVIDLDDLGTRAAVQFDPSLFAAGPSPVFFDEYQKVPDVLDAIKAELNTDLRPGRFVLTGSTSYSSLPAVAQSLTGRLSRLDVWPLSQGELAGTHERFVEDLFKLPHTIAHTLASNAESPSVTTRSEYIDRALAGGFPMALARKGAGRGRWLDEYVDIVVERDALAVSQIHQRNELPKLLAAYASQSAQLLNVSESARVVGISADTADRYTTLLESVFLIHRLPAWGRTLRRSVVGKPKIHFRDSGLAGRLLKLTAAKLERKSPSVLVEFGHLFETFCVNELLKQASWSDETIKAAHWRTHDGQEVDLVLEAPDGRVVGFEVKAGSRITEADFSGLRTLRDQIGDDFVAGIVLNTGTLSYGVDDRIFVSPADRLWT
jgi:uncharacterized protein